MKMRCFQEIHKVINYIIMKTDIGGYTYND